MKIIVIGIGKIGYVLTKQLAQEGHHVIAVDRNPELLHVCQDKLDVAVVAGNGASVEVLQEAEAGSADLTIAVTSSDEVNLLCGLVAKKLGCHRVIARVRNPEYDQQMALLTQDLGLAFSINPEKSTAREIFHLIQSPSFLKREFFAGGRAEMAEFRITAGSKLANKRLDRLEDIFKQKSIICAVERDGHVIIPSGGFELHEDDKVTVAAATRDLPELIRDLGLTTRKISRVLIVGGSHIAAYLAKLLEEAKVSVAIIESCRERCEALCAILPNTAIIHGNGTEQSLLLDEGIREADAVVTLTGIDEENLLVSMFANHEGVPKTITKINRMEYSSIFAGMGIDTIVSPKLITAAGVVQYVRSLSASREGSVETLYRIVGEKAEALGFTVPDSGAFLDVPLAHLPLTQNTLIAAIIRGQHVIIPRGTDRMLPGDAVVVVAEADRAIANLTDIFSDREGAAR